MTTDELRAHLELLADAASLPSEDFRRCEGCGASYRKEFETCPLCKHPNPDVHDG